VTHTRQPNRPASRAAARRIIAVAATALAAAGTITAPAWAATSSTSTVKITASDDSYTSSSRPSYTFGESGSIVAGAKSGDRMVSYLKFKVGTLPAGASVRKVELKLTRDTSTKLPSNVKVKKVANTSWTETALSYKNAPTSGSDVASASPKARIIENSTSAPPQMPAFPKPGTGAETMPLTCPMRNGACGSSTRIANRNRVGMTARRPAMSPALGR